jgi:hypothetical protein
MVERQNSNPKGQPRRAGEELACQGEEAEVGLAARVGVCRLEEGDEGEGIAMIPNVDEARVDGGQDDLRGEEYFRSGRLARVVAASLAASGPGP